MPALVLLVISAASAAETPAAGHPVVMDAVTVRAAASKECHISFRLKYIFWGAIDEAEFDQVDPASVVARSGIKPNDRIDKIDGRPVLGMSVRDFIQSLSRANRAVQFLVDSGSAGSLRNVQVVFPPNYWTWNMDNPPKTGPTATPRETSNRWQAGLQAGAYAAAARVRSWINHSPCFPKPLFDILPV